MHVRGRRGPSPRRVANGGGEPRRRRLSETRRPVRRALAAAQGVPRGHRRGRHRLSPTRAAGGGLQALRGGERGVPRRRRGDGRPLRVQVRRSRAARFRAGAAARRGRGRPRACLPRAGRRGACSRGGRGVGRGRRGAAGTHPPLQARVAGRRDGLRRRVPRDGDAALRTAGQPGAHPQARPHGDRRNEPRGHRRGRRVPGPASSRREGVEVPLARAADARRRARRRQPLGDALRRRRALGPHRRSGARARPSESQGVRGPLVGLHRAARVRRRARACADRRGEGELDLALLPAVPAHARRGRGARARCCRAGDGAPDLHADHRRRRPRRGEHGAPLPPSGRDGRRADRHDGRDADPALPPGPSRGPNRRDDAGLSDPSDARAAR